MEKRYPYCKFTINEERRIIEQYKNGLSMAALGKKYNCNPGTIKNILKAYSITSRTLSEARRNSLNYTINEDIFENINTPEKAYWLGVMYADGYICKEQYTNKFGISVKETDKEWLEKFKEFLNYSGEVKIYKQVQGYAVGSNYARLLIGNNKIVEDLKKLGVVEHKTKIINKIPNINFVDDFIRGYIDGDGSLLKRLPNFQISGNKEFLLNIANYLKIPYKLYPDKSIYNLKYNTKESRYLEKRLYKNATVYLDRKYQIAKRSFDSPLTLEDVMENPLNCGEVLKS